MPSLNTQVKRYIVVYNTIKELEKEKELLRKEIMARMKIGNKKTFTVPTGVVTIPVCNKRTLDPEMVYKEIDDLEIFLEVVKVSIESVEKILSPDIIESCVSGSVPIEKLLVFNT